MINRRSAAAPTPPKHLKPATKRWFAAVFEQYSLEEHHEKLLTLAGEAWDRCCAAREALAEHGIVYTDRFGAPRARPEVAIERDSSIAFARLIRELDLDIAPPSEPRRAPALTSNRRT
jgi:phage terminase small subunit